MIRFIWTEDPHIYLHERTRIQLVLFLQILAYSAARPGAIVESSCYRKSRQALTYKVMSYIEFFKDLLIFEKDLTLRLQRDPLGGPPAMSLDITFNFRKNEVGNDEALTMTLWEDLQYRDLCPITLFLSLALQDNAFADITRREQLYPKELNNEIVIIEFKESIPDTPLFRASSSCDGRIKDIAPWTYAGCHGQVVALGYRAGRAKTNSHLYAVPCLRTWNCNIIPEQTREAQSRFIAISSPVGALWLRPLVVEATVASLQNHNYSPTTPRYDVPTPFYEYLRIAYGRADNGERI